MNDDLEAACDEVCHGTNGEDFLVMSACPGCHYVAGAAVAFGLVAMAEAIRTRPFDPFARLRGSQCTCSTDAINQCPVCRAADDRSVTRG